MTQAERARKSEARSIESGAVRMPGGLLYKDAADALESLLESGYASSKLAVIAKALKEAAERRFQ